MTKADELLKECGFTFWRNFGMFEEEKTYFKKVHELNRNLTISFDTYHKDVKISNDFIGLSPKLIKAIYEKCKELGWYE